MRRHHHASLPLAIIVGGVIIAIAVYASLYSTQRLTVLGATSASTIRPVNPNDHILGDPTAPIKIVEYADFECSNCKNLDETLRQLVANDGTGKKVALILREFPNIQNISSLQDAETAECVAQTSSLTTFWNFVDSLYANAPIDPLTYGALGQASGVTDISAFTSCFMNAPTTVDRRIEADSQEARKLGATVAPFSVIIAPGTPPATVSGTYSYDAIKQVVDALVQKSGS